MPWSLNIFSGFLVALIFWAAPMSMAESSVRNQYTVFGGREDFESYLAKAFPRNSQFLVKSTDPRYQRVGAILSVVWKGFQEHSPDRAKGLHQPQVAMLNNEHIDAYVTDDAATKMIPNAIFLYTGVMSLPDNEIAALLAHELTHLLNPDFVARYYEVTTFDEPLGYQQQNNPEIEKLVKQWQAITQLVGPYHLPELNGLPLPVAYDGQLYNFIQLMALHWGDAKKVECQKVQAPLPPWRADLVLKYLSGVDQSIQMSDLDKAELSRKTKDYVSDLRSCIGHVKAPLVPSLAMLLHENENAMAEKYSSQAEVFDAEANIVDGLFAVVRSETKKLQAFQSKHSMNQYRIYSHEEFADDEAVRVLKRTPYSPFSLGNFFLSLMGELRPIDRQICEKLLQTGKTPPYGMLTDPHHSPCYRVYHSNRMAE